MEFLFLILASLSTLFLWGTAYQIVIVCRIIERQNSVLSEIRDALQKIAKESSLK